MATTDVSAEQTIHPIGTTPALPAPASDANGFDTPPMPARAFALNGLFVALFACLLMALLAHAGPTPPGFRWVGRLALFLQPFALPAFLAFAGIACHALLRSQWRVASHLYLEPAIIYSALWLTLAAAASHGAGLTSLPAVAVFAASVRDTVAIWELPALLALPAIMFTVQRLLGSLRPLYILALAITLHLMDLHSSWSFINTALSGFVYFVIGTTGARHFRALATWSSTHPTLAIVMLCVWCLYSALATFQGAPLVIGDVAIASLPVAKLGLALAGIGAIAMISGLIGPLKSLADEPRLSEVWRAITLAAPLTIGAICGLLVATRLAPTHAGAMAVLMVVGCTAVVGFAFVRIFGFTDLVFGTGTAAKAQAPTTRRLRGQIHGRRLS